MYGTYGFAITEVLRQETPERIEALLALLEACGAGAAWYGENVGSEAFATAGVLLARSRTLVIAPGVANMAARAPAAMAAGRRILASAFPGRFALGIGVSHDEIVRAYGGEPFASPLAELRSYATAMEALPGGRGDPPAPTLVAALGPRMIELTAELGYGVHAWNVTAEHTAEVRRRLGSDGLVAPRQAVLFCEDATAARAAARAHVSKYLVYPNYVRSWKRQGFTDDDLAGGGSDRLVDAMVAWGSLDDVTARVAELWDAGADHVCLHVLSLPGQRAVEALRAAVWDLCAIRVPREAR